MDVRVRYAGALCLLCFCTCAMAVSPADGSDAVLARHAQDGGELQLQYTRDVGGQDPQTVAVGLGKDYHYIQDPRGLRLYDYRLRRIYSVDPDHHFTNDSLYAEVWFRVSELDNRVRLRKMMQAGGLPLDKDPVQRGDLAGRTRWVVGDAEVAAVRFDAEPVPEALRGGLRRLWGTVVHLHPLIADDLAASGKMPQELWITTQRMGQDPVVIHWQLTSRRWQAQAHYPLPAHLTALPAPTRSASVYPEIFALLSREVADHAVPPAQDVYASRAQAAIDRGAGVEAMLLLIEMNLALGHPASACAAGDPRMFCGLAAKAGPLLKSDGRYAIGFARQSPDVADRPQFDSLPNAYLLRLLWATRPPGKGVVRENTERDLLLALKSGPIADFTKDTGDFYAMGFQAFAAWQVWDLGRLMAGHVPDDLLHAIDSVEDQLYVGVPSLF